MNFTQLKKIIEDLKKKIDCPFCGNKFHNKDIYLLGAIPTEVTFHINCHTCFRSALASVISRKMYITEDSVIEIQPIGDTISSNEILDMHNFLKNFNGDLSKYLN